MTSSIEYIDQRILVNDKSGAQYWEIMKHKFSISYYNFSDLGINDEQARN